MSDCIFCKIAGGEIPSITLFAHIVAKKVATALKEATGCEGVNILQNNGEIAGQSVFHLHIHVIPRYSKDDANIKWTPGTQDVDKLNAIAEKVQKIL